MANQAEDDCQLDNKSVSENADGVFASFKSEESDDAMVGAASGVSPWAKTANHRDGTGSSASAAASRLAAVVFDVRHSDGPGLLCPKDTDHTHPLLDGLPFHFGPKSNTPRRSLTLRERVRVIELYRAGNSIRKIADDFGVGKTQIQTTLKKRNEYLTDFANEVSGESRRRTRKSPYDQINDVCMEWFRDCTLEGLRVTGAMVQEKALQLAGQLGIHDFKASNGWLDSFLKRSGIRTTTPTKEARKNVHALSTSTLLSLRQTLGIDTDVNETESSKHPSLEYSSDDSSAEGCEMVPSGFDNHSTAVAASSHLRRLSTDTRHSHSADSQSGSTPVQPDLGMENASFHDVDQESSVKVKTEPFDTYTIKKEAVEDVSAVESSEEIGSVTLPTSSCHETGMTDNPSIISDGEDNEFNHSKKTTCVLDNLLAQSLQKGLPAQGNQCDKIPERQESQEIYLCHVSLPAHNSNLVSNMASSECSSHIRTSDVLAVWHDSVRPGSGWDMYHGDQLVSTMYQLWQDGRHLDLQLDINGIIVWVHKLVVLAVSPCASLLFMGDGGQPANCLRVRLSPPVSRSAVSALVFFMYTGRLVERHSTVHDLEHLAKALHITSLHKMCRVFLGTLSTSTPSSDRAGEGQPDREATERSEFHGCLTRQGTSWQSQLSQHQADTDISDQAVFPQHQHHSQANGYQGVTGTTSCQVQFSEQQTSI